MLRQGRGFCEGPASDGGRRRVQVCVSQLPWGFQSNNRTFPLEDLQCVCGAEKPLADNCSLAWPGMEIPRPPQPGSHGSSGPAHQSEQEDPGCLSLVLLVGWAGENGNRPVQISSMKQERREYCGNGPVSLTTETRAQQVGATGTYIKLFNLLSINLREMSLSFCLEVGVSTCLALGV